MKIVYITLLALTITATASADIFEVPQDFGPVDMEHFDASYSYSGVDYVTVDSMSTMYLTVYWGKDLVNPNSYTWGFENDTDTVMQWDSFEFGRDINRFDLSMTLQHKAPAWGRNCSEISMARNAVPAPGVFALFGLAALVARRQRTR